MVNKLAALSTSATVRASASLMRKAAPYNRRSRVRTVVAESRERGYSQAFTACSNCFRRFLKKNILIQDVGAGLIKMSYLGKFGSRFNRASTACIAVLPSEM